MKQSKNYQKAMELCELFQEFTILKYIPGGPKIQLKCNNCGYEFIREARHFIEYPHVCPRCKPKGTSQKITFEEAQRRVNNVYGDRHFTLLDYKGNNIAIDVKCEYCGYIFQSVPASLWRKRLRGCPNCEQIKSLGEREIEKYLRENNIQYQTQKRFLDCKDEKPLPFDFYLPQFNTCIEFQGEQHYTKHSFMWSEKLIKHDQIKVSYCIMKNIQLITIPYTDIDNIEFYLKAFKKD